MTDIICRDNFGNEVNLLTQWDVNRVLNIEGIDIEPLPRFRFSNKTSAVSLVVKPSVDKNIVRVDIPNILLQQPDPIIISIFYEYDDNSLQTYCTFVIPVIPQMIPEDYVMSDNVEYTSWLEVQEKAERLMYELETKQDRGTLRISDVEPYDSDVIWFNTNVAS